MGEENQVTYAWAGPGRGGHKCSSPRSSHSYLLGSQLANLLRNRYCSMLKLITMFGASPPSNSLECNLVLEKLPLFCTTSSRWLLFLCLCHWADQSLAGFTGSISCECVWKCCLITGAHLSGQQQAGELTEMCQRVRANH